MLTPSRLSEICLTGTSSPSALVLVSTSLVSLVSSLVSTPSATDSPRIHYIINQRTKCAVLCRRKQFVGQTQVQCTMSVCLFFRCFGSEFKTLVKLRSDLGRFESKWRFKPAIWRSVWKVSFGRFKTHLKIFKMHRETLPTFYIKFKFRKKYTLSLFI